MCGHVYIAIHCFYDHGCCAWYPGSLISMATNIVFRDLVSNKACLGLHWSCRSVMQSRPARHSPFIMESQDSKLYYDLSMLNFTILNRNDYTPRVVYNMKFYKKEKKSNVHFLKIRVWNNKGCGVNTSQRLVCVRDELIIPCQHPVRFHSSLFLSCDERSPARGS